MRDRNAEKPWIGTFGFEGEEGVPPVPSNDAAVADTPGASGDERDLEKQSPNGSMSASAVSSEQEKGKGEEGKDPNLVSFEGPDDTMNPMNWNPFKKWRVTASKYPL